ncbi:MAG TPA: (d)CMP kinase [Phycisphaerae bacterium]|nr:(d)CMP kinase [Phycisphaerae bacterium]
MIITIDGPAGAGKSTAARKLAQALGIAFLDTGVTYRAVTLRVMRSGVDLRDAEGVAEQARGMDLKMMPGPDGVRVVMDGLDVSDDIRTEEISTNVHYVANDPQVREILVELQRQIGRKLGDFVTEGRDQGTVVFPDADIKFYINADATQRAKRRRNELADRGQAANHETILQAIVDRDRRDAGRDVGALRVPHGAIQIDTTTNTIEQTLAELLRYVPTEYRTDGEVRR